jgi:hypothetical protein
MIPEKKSENVVYERLYIEEYIPTKSKQQMSQDEEDDDNRGIIVIDLMSDE